MGTFTQGENVESFVKAKSNPLTGRIVNSERKSLPLNKVSSALTRLKMGENEQHKISIVGDSWVRAADRGVGPMARLLQTTYGNAGGGWCAFAGPSSTPNGAARNDLYTVTVGAGWTLTPLGLNTPDQSRAGSSVAGSLITVTFPAGSTSVRLLYNFVGGSSIRYRWDGGSWNSQSTASGTSALLTGVPATAGTLEIENVAGLTYLSGLVFNSTAPGVVVNKCGAGETTAANWLALGAGWEIATAWLDTDTWVIVLGCNDLQANLPPATFVTNLASLIARLRAASYSTSEVLVVLQPEVPNWQARQESYRSADYARAVLATDFGPNTSVLDMQPTFGADPTIYSSAGRFPLFNSDGVHLDTTTGALAFARLLYQELVA